MKPRKPFQFSLATLMLVVTAYAVLFAILRSLRVSNLAFLSVTLYLTTVVYSQWALWGGRRPYEASALTSGGLFVLALLAQFRSVPHWHLAIGLEFALLPAFGVGAVVGLGVAGSIDVGLMLSEIVRDIRHSRGSRTRRCLPRRRPPLGPRTAGPPPAGVWRCWPRWRGCFSW